MSIFDLERRKWLKGAMAITLTPPLMGALSACSGSSSSSGGSVDPDVSSDSTFYVPPEVSPNSANVIQLEARTGSTEFYSGVASETKGYVDLNNPVDSPYLGPTIRVTASNPNGGDSGTPMVDQGTQSANANTVSMEVSNETGSAISAHWHGLHIDGQLDGAGFNTIADGETWSPSLPIYQQAGTNWYHTHIHHSTAIDVYKGLAGLFIVEDANSLALAEQGLPSTYGVDDFPLVIQDKRFINSVMDVSAVDQTVCGGGVRFAGDTFLVNGVIEPSLSIEQGLNRFRLLNASNARFYNYYLEHNGAAVPFSMIATDGGFLAAPAEVSELPVSPGERYEFVIDFSGYAVGDVLTLKSSDEEDDEADFTLMTFTVVDQTVATAANALPTTLNADLSNDRTTLLTKTPDAYVNISLRGTGGDDSFHSARSTTDANPAAIAHIFDMEDKNFTSTSTQTQAGWTEEWTIRGNRHPFHLHGCHAMIKSIGGSTDIPAYLQGWKDVFLIDGGQDVIFMVQFDERAYDASSRTATSPNEAAFMYMMHCHILNHEDACMMGVFEVV